jgi:hypothetical protein
MTVLARLLESLHETLFWLSRPGFRDDMEQSAADEASGNLMSSEEISSRLGLSARVDEERRVLVIRSVDHRAHAYRRR